MDTRTLAANYNAARLLGLENEQDTLGKAETRLKDIDTYEGTAQTDIERAIETLARAVNASKEDLNAAYASMYDLLSDLTYRARKDLEAEIEDLKQMIGDDGSDR